MPPELAIDAADLTGSAAAARPPWVVVQAAGTPRPAATVPGLRRVLLQLAAAALVVLAAVGVVGVLISQRSAEKESVHEAAELTNVLAESVVQPALTDPMASSTRAAAALDALVRSRVLSPTLVRVKIWSPAGRILYSDEPRLVGRSFALDASARLALTNREVRADVTDLGEPENRYERGNGKLLEVHRPVWTPDGSPMLFETYFRYEQVSVRAGQLWRGFAGITISSIIAVVVLLVPLGWTLVARARRAQHQREAGLRRAVEASGNERRRIAAALHDGVVQELVAASFAVSAGAQASHSHGDPALAEQLNDAAAAVRSGIGGMRSLLVDIYPPTLHSAGLDTALSDLAAGLRIEVELDIDAAAAEALDREQTEAVFRVAQEALRNAAAHAGVDRARLHVRAIAGAVLLEIIDDGAGFDVDVRPEGHFGLSLLVDFARGAGAGLELRTAPGAGTAWRLRLPVRPALLT